MTLSAVIPTRNRPEDLGKAVASILAQTRLPDELVIVDQSPGDASVRLVEAMFTPGLPVRLVYIHDAGITGLVHAKRVGSTRAIGDIVCFLEDDIVLEPDYVEEVERGFAQRPDMAGCSGVITNSPMSSWLFTTVRGVFFQGIFYDPRLASFNRAMTGGAALIPCDVLAGGVSSWRRHVFERVPFDTRNGFHMVEDMEFSTRVVRALGHCLYINPKARLEHKWSDVNRDVHGARQRRKLSEGVIYYKTRRGWAGARRGLAMIMVWWFGEALMQSARGRSLGPITGYFLGVVDGVRKPLVG
jgi:GT2 family glycosyltransferase